MLRNKRGELDPTLAAWGAAFLVPLVTAIFLYIGHSTLPRRVASFLSKPVELDFANLIVDERLGVEIDCQILLLTCKENVTETSLNQLLTVSANELSINRTDLVLLNSFDNGRTWPLRVPPPKRHTIADRLRRHPSIMSVGFNTVHRLAQTTGVISNEAGDSWGLSAIKAHEAWQLTKGEGSSIAFVDSGALVYHPALSSKMTNPYSLATDSANMQVGSFVSPGGSLRFVTSHGTHLAAIACGDKGSNNWQSVAPQANFIPVQSLWYRQHDNEILGGAADIVAGIRYSIAAGAQVICIGSEPCIDRELAAYYRNSPRLIKKAIRFVMKIPLSISLESFRMAIDEANKSGVIIVKAAGNQDLPAWFDEICASRRVITVGAIDKNNGRADFSNYGKEVTVSAPGVNILGGTANPNKQFSSMSGTSVAAAHVAGVVALMKSKNPSLTLLEVKDILIRTGRPIPGKDKSIGPLVNAEAAVMEVVKRLKDGVTPPKAEAPLLSPIGRPVPSVGDKNVLPHIGKSEEVKSTQKEAVAETKESGSSASSTAVEKSASAGDETVAQTKNSGSSASSTTVGEKSKKDDSPMAPQRDPSKIYVNFKSEPAGAKVYCYNLPSRYIGKTPISFGFAPGNYRFKYALPGHEDKVFERSLKQGETPSIEFSLAPKEKTATKEAVSKKPNRKPTVRRGSGGIGSPEHANKFVGTWVALSKHNRRYTNTTSNLKLRTLAFHAKAKEVDITCTATKWTGPFGIQRSKKWFYEPEQEVARLKPGNTYNHFYGRFNFPEKGWVRVSINVSGQWAHVTNKKDNVGFDLYRVPPGESYEPLYARSQNTNGLVNAWANKMGQGFYFEFSGGKYLGYYFSDPSKRQNSKVNYRLNHLGGGVYKGKLEMVNVFKRVFDVTLTVKNNVITRVNETSKRTHLFYRLNE